MLGWIRFASMNTAITGLHSELGAILAQRVAAGAIQKVHFNVVGQQANSLLHDGHAWEDFPHKVLAGTRRALQAAHAAKAQVLVHASFAFVHAFDQGARLREPLRASVQALLACEKLVLSGPVPACVVRLGYLYGPDSADLRAYRSAFRIGRPYWSGRPQALQYHLHQADAVSALLRAASPHNADKTFYATDGMPVSFTDMMDAFAHRVGRASPLHLPLCLRPLAHLVIREEHMQQTALSMPPDAPRANVPRWKPKFADCRLGLDQVVTTWDN
jgi:nucleoside-diphosphate-sugar epimerase